MAGGADGGRVMMTAQGCWGGACLDAGTGVAAVILVGFRVCKFNFCGDESLCLGFWRLC